MTQIAPAAGSTSEASQHFDVAIIGARIAGIGAAYHLKTQCPATSFVILEAQESFGGTWITHRYPGVRSDSDLNTFGYRFKPWIGKPIAAASEILAYLGEVIDDNGLDAHIRYRHRIGRARWSSADNLWTLEGGRGSDGATVRFTANFLWMCQGYYRHEKGYTPDWAGMEAFAGRIVHPQSWPEDLDCTGKSVVVIGSGATAATIIPAIAGRCNHVTMLQRSPTYYITGRNANTLTDTLRELDVSEESGPPNHPQKGPLRSGCFHTPLLQRAGRRQDGPAFSGPRTPRRRLRCGDFTFRQSTGHGGSASPSFPTLIFSRRSAREKPPWSRMRSKGSRSPAS